MLPYPGPPPLGAPKDPPSPPPGPKSLGGGSGFESENTPWLLATWVCHPGEPCSVQISNPLFVRFWPVPVETETSL